MASFASVHDTFYTLHTWLIRFVSRITRSAYDRRGVNRTEEDFLKSDVLVFHVRLRMCAARHPVVLKENK